MKPGQLLLLLAVAALATKAPAAERQPHQKTERFDRDPGWDAHNNRVKVERPIHVSQDFGYTKTRHAGGNAAGEMGGRIQRSTTPAFYGKHLAYPRSLDHKLRCSGTFAVTQSTGMTSLYFGWFNTKTMEVRPRNWLGMYIKGEENGCEIAVGYNNSAGRSEGIRVTGVGPRGAAAPDFNQIPKDGTPYTFDFLYDPDANGGTGQVTFTLGGKGPFQWETAPPISTDGSTHTWKIDYNPNADGGQGCLTVWIDDRKDSFTLPPSFRTKGAKFDRFGLSVQENGGRGSHVYFDDLEYTSINDQVDSSIRTLNGHTSSVMGVEFSPDGKVLTSCCRDSTIKLWDPSTGKLLRTLNEHTGDVYDVVYSPGGDLLASSGKDRIIRIWEARTGKVIRTLEGHQDIVRSVAFSPDQKTLASGSVDLTVRLWDVATGKLKQTLNGHTVRVMSVGFSPDVTLLASASSDGTARLWDPRTGKLIRVLQGHTSGLECLDFSPDGKQIATSSNDTTVRLWNAMTGKLLHTMKGHTEEVDSVEFSPDGKTVASGCKDKTIKLWDAQTGKPIRTLTGHTGRVESLTFSPDGKFLATGGGGGDTAIKLWDLTNKKE